MTFVSVTGHDIDISNQYIMYAAVSPRLNIIVTSSSSPRAAEELFRERKCTSFSPYCDKRTAFYKIRSFIPLKFARMNLLCKVKFLKHSFGWQESLSGVSHLSMLFLFIFALHH